MSKTLSTILESYQTNNQKKKRSKLDQEETFVALDSRAFERRSPVSYEETLCEYYNAN